MLVARTLRIENELNLVCGCTLLNERAVYGHESVYFVYRNLLKPPGLEYLEIETVKWTITADYSVASCAMRIGFD